MSEETPLKPLRHSTELSQSHKMTKLKDEKLPLLDSESHSESTELPSTETVVELNKPDSNLESSKSEEYNPLLNRTLEHPTSNLDTMIHLLKGNIGTGILAMPDAFRNAGWVVGLFGTLFMGTICTHCMHMLVGCAHELCRRKRVSAMGFSEVAEAAFETGPAATRRLAGVMKALINIFLCITQIGFCCVYFVFVAANLHDVVANYVADISVYWYLVLLLIPIIVLNLVKKLKYITPSSLIAALLTVIGLTITFYYIFNEGLPKISTVNAFSTWKQLPLYFGTAIYAFEGIGVILPLENDMKNPQDFGGWNGVLNTGMVIVATLYTAVGFYGYLKYGDLAKQGSITLYLPANEFMAQAVRVLMAAAILLSYSLQFYVPFNIIWPLIKNHLRTDKQRAIGEYITRISLIFLTFCLAAAVPNLGAVISLVGALSSSALALIFPPLIEIITFWPNNLGHKKWILWKDLATMLFGIIGFIFGSYVSIYNILIQNN